MNFCTEKGTKMLGVSTDVSMQPDFVGGILEPVSEVC